MSTAPTVLTGKPALPARVGAANPASAPTSVQFTIKDFIRVIRNRLVLIVVMTILFTVAGGGLCMFLKRTSPQYTAENYIACEMPQSSLLSPDLMLPRQDVIQLNAASYAADLTSEGFLNKVLGHSRVQESAWYNKIPKHKSFYEELQNAFSARPMRNTKYIRVTMTAGNSKDAKDILDTIIEMFLDDKGFSQNQTLSNNKDALNKKILEFNKQIQTKENEMDTLSTQAVAGWRANQSGGTVVAQEISRYHESIMLLNAEINSLKSELARLEAGANDTGEIQVSGNVLAAVEQDPLILGLRNQITNLIQQRDRLLERFGEKHREVRDYQALISVAENQLNEQRNNLVNQYAVMEYNNLQDQLGTYQNQLAEITDKYDRALKTQKQLDDNAIKYFNIKDELDRLYTQVELYNQRIGEIDTKINNSEAVTVKRGGITVEPNRISFPKQSIFLPGGFLLGLLAGLGLAFLLEIADDTVKSPTDVMRFLNTPLLGMIPQYESDNKSRDVVEKIVATQPNALISEFYRQIRTNLIFSAPPEEMKTILITSGAAGCGKTTCAVNLATALAAEDKKVLLVDANFRRPKLSKLFPTEKSKQGLSNVLVNQATLADVVYKSTIKNLDILFSGPLPPNPADLVSSPQMKTMLDKQRDHYDYIILDGPPALIVVDARIFASIIDGTIVVINAESTARGMAQRLIRELRSANGNNRILGILLNNVKTRKGGYFAKTYESYYDYISSEPSVMGVLQSGTETKQA